MDNSANIRDILIRNLKSETGYEEVVSADISGNYFSAADIAIPNNDGNCDIYRIAVIKHHNQKSYS